MSRIQPAIIGKTPFERLLGHDEDVMTIWSALGDTLTGDGKLSAELKEQVRRTLAQQNGCDYCRAKGNPEPHIFDERTAVAVGFAEVFFATERRHARLVDPCAPRRVHGCRDQ